MRIGQALSLGIAAITIAAVLAVGPARVSAQPSAPTIGATDVGGVVSGPNGPEAGVWVIAETTDLPTKYAKTVVTDDHGRYVIPDLPRANYSVWVRGYGLVDSPKLRAKPGEILNHTAVPAPTEAAAAHYYPAIYWYTMMKIPPTSDFGGKGSIPANITQTIWLQRMKNVDCIGCHQLGQESTRTIPAGLGEYKSHEEAWIRRIQSGQFGEQMTNRIAGELGSVPYKYFGEWTERVAKGELPFAKPKRPEGVERNIVVTTWEWSTPDKYLHDLISSDRRKPTVNAYGKLFGSPEYSTDDMPILDPKTHEVTFFKMPVLDPKMPLSLGPGHAASVKPAAPSPYWGDGVLWDTKANNHNAMFDDKGRLWIAASVRGRPNPDFCKKGSEHPSAKVFPLEMSSRQVAMLDPKTMKYTFVDTCFGTHHPQFGYDADNTLWLSGTGPVAGWINTKIFDETGDAAKAQGWSPFILDTTGNGKRDEFVEPNQPADPAKDIAHHRRLRPLRGDAAARCDGSVWYTVGVFAGRGGILRFDPKTQLSEFYSIPMPGFGPRGGDIDKQGRRMGIARQRSPWRLRPAQVQGAAQRTDGDRGPLPRGLVVPPVPGPGLPGHRATNSAESSYYTWVDQHNTLGLGDEHPDVDRQPERRLRRASRTAR